MWGVSFIENATIKISYRMDTFGFTLTFARTKTAKRYDVVLWKISRNGNGLVYVLC